MLDKPHFARRAGEKKIVSLPPLRVDEGMHRDLKGLAELPEIIALAVVGIVWLAVHIVVVSGQR